MRRDGRIATTSITSRDLLYSTVTLFACTGILVLGSLFLFNDNTFHGLGHGDIAIICICTRISRNHENAGLLMTI